MPSERTPLSRLMDENGSINASRIAKLADTLARLPRHASVKDALAAEQSEVITVVIPKAVAAKLREGCDDLSRRIVELVGGTS